MKSDNIFKSFIKDPRYIYAIILLIIAIPYIRPLGIPIQIEQYTSEFYNQIEILPPDSVVVVSVDILAHNLPELGAGGIAIMQHLFNRPLKLVFWSLDTDGPMVIEKLLASVNKGDKTYGEDYVNFGYVPGVETAAAALAENIHTLSVDFFNTPIDSLPMMKNIANANDVDLLVIFCGGAGTTPSYINQWVTTYNVKAITYSQSIVSAAYKVYRNAGQLQALMWGLRQAAEYELLIKKPGLAIADTDVLSVSVSTTILLIVLGNVYYFGWERKQHG